MQRERMNQQREEIERMRRHMQAERDGLPLPPEAPPGGGGRGGAGGGGLGHRSASSSVPVQPALAVDEMRVDMTESSIAAAPDSAELANATKPRSTPKPSHVIM